MYLLSRNKIILTIILADFLHIAEMIEELGLIWAKGKKGISRSLCTA